MPETVQMLDALPVEKVKVVRLLDAVAVSMIADEPKVTGEAGANVTVCVAGLMTTLTLANALVKLAFPA